MLVVAVGPNSQWGMIHALVSKSSEETPLQKHLEELAETIGKMGLVAATLTFISLLVQWFARHQLAGDLLTAQSLGEIVDFLITAITIVVVAVPEGLPLAVTLSLAYSMFKMMKDNNLVRHLEACETMGGATNICSDKTGTLTENRMTVVSSWIGNTVHSDSVTKSAIHPELLTLLTEGASVNSTAYIVNKDFIGSKTEGALIEFVNKLGNTFKTIYHLLSLGFDYAEIRKSVPVLKMFPFSSAKKSMSTVLPKSATRKFRIWTKGAPEIILEQCSLAYVENGKIVNCSQIKASVLNVINNFATQGRIIH
jgi:Ca2+-transporting ATPase